MTDKNSAMLAILGTALMMVTGLLINDQIMTPFILVVGGGILVYSYIWFLRFRYKEVKQKGITRLRGDIHNLTNELEEPGDKITIEVITVDDTGIKGKLLSFFNIETKYKVRGYDDD